MSASNNAANAVAPPGIMPGRSHSSAPKFDGNPLALKRFLTEVYDLAMQKGLTVQSAIKAALAYAPANDYELWRSRPAAAGNDWEAFETQLCALYPGAEGDRKYNRHSLDVLVRRSSQLPMTDALQFGEYYRSFLNIVTYLQEKKRIHEQEISARFLEGLHHTFRADLVDHLRAREPTHHVDDPWELDELYKSCLFLLSNREVSNVGPSANHQRMHTPEPVVKTETFDATAISRILESDVFLAKFQSMMSSFQPPRNQYRNTYQQHMFQGHPNMNQQNPAQQGGYVRPEGCLFCSDRGHFQYDCPTAADYLGRGLVARNDRQQLVMPNGARIGAGLAAGNNLRERVDNWYRANGGNHATGPPTASTNFYDVSATDANDAWKIFTHEVTPESDQTMTQRDIEEIEILQHVARNAHQKIEETRARMHGAQFGPTTRARSYGNDSNPPAKKTPDGRDAPPHLPYPVAKQTTSPVVGAPVNAQEGRAAPPKTNRNPFMSQKSPQFSYNTPIEDPQVTKKVYDSAMDAPITLSTRQLLAVAPDVRKLVKEQIMARRNPQNEPHAAVNELAVAGAREEVGEPEKVNSFSVEAFLQAAAASPDIVVANHIEDLRCITVNVEGAGPVEAILDDGSQIIAMRADVWARTGLPLRTDHQMIMESANRQKNDTKGLLPDLEVRIGEFKFYLQVQVIENASYEMLLGRPFLTLCQASTRHFANGDAHITLIDPNTQAVVTLSTHQRVKNDQSGKAPSGAGF